MEMCFSLYSETANKQNCNCCQTMPVIHDFFTSQISMQRTCDHTMLNRVLKSGFERMAEIHFGFCLACLVLDKAVLRNKKAMHMP